MRCARSADPACAGCGFVNPDGFRFCGRCGGELQEPASVPSDTDTPWRAADAGAERRQLTIMFCDLVGSTRLSHRMDPEEYHALLMAYRASCMRSIEHYGGSEVRHIGDGTQAYFGYPRAFEDAAERAVLTALDIVRDVARLARSPRWAHAAIAVRIGIGSGPVITDPGSSPDGAGPRLTEALGETPNLAARIQNAADVNGVVVGPLTRRLLGNLFTLIDLGERDFKGIDHPVHVWQVVGIAAVDRFEATRTPSVTLVDRERELSTLLDAWTDAAGGRGRVVVLSGEGGIGKSRLVRALHERIVRRELPSSLYLQCSPIHGNTALYPVIAAIESRAGLRHAGDEEHRLERLRELLERSSVPVERLLPLLALLLDTREDASGSSPSVDWRELRERLIDALVEHVRRMSERRPLLIVLEDLQWIDPSTGELLARTVRAIMDRRVLIVAVCRPEVLAPWFRLAHVTMLPLGSLGPEHAATLARRVAGDRALPPAVLEEIVAKSGGVPLFVEEIVRMLTSSGPLRAEGDAWVQDGALSPLAIPPTLSDSLMARLDRLGTARRFAQLGAVIGQDFTLQLLAAVAAEPERQVAAELDSLVAAGVLNRWSAESETLYSFGHALMRDAALESMLRGPRQRMHAAVARVLESRFPAVGLATPELLARHHGEAGDAARAIEQWLLAGRRASARSETLEAIAHLRGGLASIPPDRPDEAMERRHLELLIALGPALITHVGPGAEEVRETYRGALALCARLPESPAHFAAYWGWWRVSRNFGEKADAARTLLALAERLDDPGLALEAHHALWATSFVLGEQALSLAHVDHGLALYVDGDYRDHAATYGGHDAQVCGEGEAALVLWLTARAREGGRRMRRALALAEHLEHVGSRAHALDYALMLHFYRRDVVAVRAHAERQIALAAENRFGDYEMRALVFLGWALGLQGEPDAALRAIRKGILAQRSSGTTEDFPIFFSMQAEVHLQHGQIDEAGVMLREASDYAAEQEVRLWDAEIHRLRAIVALLSGPRRDDPGTDGPAPGPATAAEHLRRALTIAERQGAGMLAYKVIESVHWAFAEPLHGEDARGVASDGTLGGTDREPRAGDPTSRLAALERSMLPTLRGERVVDPAHGTRDAGLAAWRSIALELLALHSTGARPR